MRNYLAHRFYFLPQIIVAFIIAPIGWMLMDRTPPLTLYDGRIEPNVVRQYQTGVSVTWRAHQNRGGQDCPGFSQREIIDSSQHIDIKVIRSRRGVFTPDSNNPLVGTVNTPPLDIGGDLLPGPVYYKVTNWYFCTPLIRWLYAYVGIDWSIKVESPLIKFQVIPGTPNPDTAVDSKPPPSVPQIDYPPAPKTRE